MFENIVRLKAGEQGFHADFGLAARVVFCNFGRFVSILVDARMRRNRMKTTARLDEPRGRGR